MLNGLSRTVIAAGIMGAMIAAAPAAQAAHHNGAKRADHGVISGIYRVKCFVFNHTIGVPVYVLSGFSKAHLPVCSDRRFHRKRH